MKPFILAIALLCSSTAMAKDAPRKQACGQDASQCRIACLQAGGNVSRCVQACQRELVKCEKRAR